MSRPAGTASVAQPLGAAATQARAGVLPSGPGVGHRYGPGRRDAAHPMAVRWRSMQMMMAPQGHPADESCTEAARVGAHEAWELLNLRRRRERAVGSPAEAEVLAAALRPLQEIIVFFLRHPADVEGGLRIVAAAHRAATAGSAPGSAAPLSASPARTAVERSFRSLETLLGQSASRAA